MEEVDDAIRMGPDPGSLSSGVTGRRLVHQVLDMFHRPDYLVRYYPVLLHLLRTCGYAMQGEFPLFVSPTKSSPGKMFGGW